MRDLLEDLAGRSIPAQVMVVPEREASCLQSRHQLEFQLGGVEGMRVG